MGYEMPNVVKDIYLPIDINFIDGASDDTFKSFAEDYKDKYGIDLHDLFDLGKDGLAYYIRLKNYAKIYAVSVTDEGTYKKLCGYICPAIFTMDEQTDESGSLIIVAITIRDQTNNVIYGIGFALNLYADNLTPASIDDLRVSSYKV